MPHSRQLSLKDTFPSSLRGFLQKKQSAIGQIHRATGQLRQAKIRRGDLGELRAVSGEVMVLLKQGRRPDQRGRVTQSGPGQKYLVIVNGENPGD